MSRLHHRVKVGSHFNEGARLLQAYLQANVITQAELTRTLGVALGVVNRWLYGDVRPSVKWALAIQRTTQIPVVAWHSPAEGPFVPPASIPMGSSSFAPDLVIDRSPPPAPPSASAEGANVGRRAHRGGT